MKTLIFLLDQSGSMSNIANDMLGSVNYVIEEQKKISIEEKININCEVITFSDAPIVEINKCPIHTIPLLTSYNTIGGTALNDAIAYAIRRNIECKEVMLVIVTDGEENQSIEFAGSIGTTNIKKMINKQKDKGWCFVYLSAGLKDQGINIGIDSPEPLQRATRSTTTNIECNYDQLPTQFRRSVSNQIYNYTTTGYLSNHPTNDINVTTTTNTQNITSSTNRNNTTYIEDDYNTNRYIGNLINMRRRSRDILNVSGRSVSAPAVISRHQYHISNAGEVLYSQDPPPLPVLSNFMSTHTPLK